MIAFALALAVFAQVPAGSQRSGTVTGQVRTQDGRAAEGVRIAVLEAPEGSAKTLAGSMLAGLAETDSLGRFQIESVSPGRYYVTAGFLDSPTYYPGVSNPTEAKAITVAAGTTVSGIDFTLVRSVGVRISGRVKGFPAGAAGLRAILQPLAGTSGALPVESPVQSDGSFRFTRVFPGAYNVLVNSAALPGATLTIDVGDKDLDLELAAPFFVTGQVTVDDGSGIPALSAAIAAGYRDPPSLVQLQAQPVIGGPSILIVARADGTFLLKNLVGNFKLVVTMIPFGYWVKSMSFGPVDLTKDSLRLSADPAPEHAIQIVLTTEVPDNTLSGATVSGRVSGIPNDSQRAKRWVAFQTQEGTAAVGRVIEAPIGSDGTFAIRHVPPGKYVARVYAIGAVSGSPATVIVADTDVSGVELSAAAPNSELLRLIH